MVPGLTTATDPYRRHHFGGEVETFTERHRGEPGASPPRSCGPAAMRLPLYGAKILTGRLNIPQTTLTNWPTRKVFGLDADQHRTDNEGRPYSAHDAILLAHAARLVAFGLPISVAKPLAERLTDAVPAYFRPRASAATFTGDELVFTGDELRIFPCPWDWFQVFSA